MKTKCSICNAPERCARVNALLAQGLSLAKVGQETGYHKSIVDRHRRFCGAASAPKVQVHDPGLDALIRRVERACAKAERRGDVKAMLEGCKQLAELRARAAALSPATRKEVTIRVITEPDPPGVIDFYERQRVVDWCERFVEGTRGNDDPRTEQVAIAAGRLAMFLNRRPYPEGMAAALDKADREVQQQLEADGAKGGSDVGLAKESGADNGSTTSAGE